MKPDHVVALKRAIESCGSQAALAERMRALGKETVTQQTVSYWLTNEVFIDPEWWPAIEFATENQVTRSELRPDVFTSVA